MLRERHIACMGKIALLHDCNCRIDHEGFTDGDKLMDYMSSFTPQQMSLTSTQTPGTSQHLLFKSATPYIHEMIGIF